MIDFDRAVERLKAKNSVHIVEYEPKYLDGTLALAHEMHAHSIYKAMQMDEVRLLTNLSMAGNIVPDRFFRLAVRDDHVLGAFYGSVAPTFFGDDLIGRDIGWWVKSDYRGGAAPILLLDAFEKWAKEKGACMCFIGQTGVENIERTKKLYLNCGYRLIGYHTGKDI